MNAEHIAKWLVEHPTVGRGRMLTVALELGMVVAEANRTVGYMDGAAADRDPAKYVELSVSLMLSRLKRAVEALDVPEVEQSLSTEVRVWSHPSEPSNTYTGRRLGPDDRIQEGDLVAVKHIKGWHVAGSLAIGLPPSADGDRYVWVRPVKEE